MKLGQHHMFGKGREVGVEEVRGAQGGIRKWAGDKVSAVESYSKP